MREQFPNVKYTLAPMVRNRARGNLAFTVSYSIARASKNKPAAWELLRYLTGPEGMRLWIQGGIALPSRSDVRSASGANGQTLLREAASARPWQFAPGFSRVMTVAGNELQAVIEGKEQIAEMIGKIESEATSALRRGR
jgi:multiple sugar transport system substrate-binding protein